MHYMGGKFRICVPVSRYLNSLRGAGQGYWEPFVGAAWVLERIAGNRYASDANPYLISMWNALQSGWIPPSIVTEREYSDIKNDPDKYPQELVAFVGIGCSWGGKWFGGYARDNRGRNYAKDAKNSLMRQLPNLRGVKFFHGDFFKTNPPLDKMLIYCDPPYEGTTGYGAIKEMWDANAFWDRVRFLDKGGHTLVISEYSAPRDFSCVLEVKTKTDIRTVDGREIRTEKLFRYGDHANTTTRIKQLRISFGI